MTSTTINLPKPILIGSGALLMLGLFLASGDPGKSERKQLTQQLTEAQQHISTLETKLSEQEALLHNQQETTQLTTRRLEATEENASRLRARIDEVERQLATQHKAALAAASRAKAMAVATKKPAPTKTHSKTTSKPIAKH